MQTSYFAKSANNPNAVSIAGRAPSWYNGREYKILAPKYWFFKRYKDKDDEMYLNQDFYVENYYNEVLSKLDPQRVLMELGENAVMLCWEVSGKFCHRHLASEWLRANLDIQITELQ